MGKGIIVIWLTMAGIFGVLYFLMKRKRKTEWENWAKQENLKYLEKIKIPIWKNEGVSVVDLVWGEYKNKKIYFYTVLDSAGDFSTSWTYFNGNFYSKIKSEEIDRLIENDKYLEKMEYIFGACIDTEIAQMLVANIFLDYGMEIEHDKAKKIYKLLEKFYSSKTSLKDKLVGGFLGAKRADIKFNTPEAINFVAEKSDGEIERSLIEKVADAYEKFLEKYDESKSDSSNSLKNIDMNKFK
jgi:hypothetical protein